MRKILLFAVFATLAGCSASEPVEDPAAAAEAETPEAKLVGTYQVTLPDGTKRISSIGKDRSYTDAVDGQVTEWGTWEFKDGKMCSTPASALADAASECVTLSEPAADGTITITADDGTTMTAKKSG